MDNIPGQLLRVGGILTMVSALSLMVAPPLWAQNSDSSKIRDASENGVQAIPSEETFSVTVEVEHANPKVDVGAGIPVTLRAARPKGPFEPTDPTPVQEWSATTNAQGQAAFSGISPQLAQKGLRLHAAAKHEGTTFKSAAVIPAPGVGLDIVLRELSNDIATVEVKSLRVIVEIWEGYLVFSEYWTLGVEGQTAVDTRQLPGADFEKGLPIELPTKAQGIRVQGPGEHKAVNSTVYWNGILKPTEPVTLTVQYSMAQSDDEAIYSQSVRYPIEDLQILAPLQTRFEKVSRLDHLELAAPGFEVRAGQNIPGVPNGMEFLSAQRKNIPANTAWEFKLSNLPFHTPIAPWIFVGLGLFAGFLILLYAADERQLLASQKGREVLERELAKERDILFEELAALEQDYLERTVGQTEYERESLYLRERLALILKKLHDLEQATTPQPAN